MKTVIELVKTTQGYSVIEDGHQINKVTNQTNKFSTKKYQMFNKEFSQQNFTIYPYLFCKQPEFSQKYIVVPAKSQWFNMNQIHEIEKKALPQWFKTKKAVFGAAKPDKFEKNQELYKKYRNYIIEMARNQYLSPTAARKGLAGDVCAIIRIHSFLQKNGLINYVFPKKPTAKQICKVKDDRWDNSISLIKRKDCVDKQKSVFEKHFDKDHLELLKKITKNYRPICHLCQGICGVVWYQYSEDLILKSFQNVPTNQQERDQDQHFKHQQNHEQRKVDQEKPKLKTKIRSAQNSFKYLLRFCSHCFTSGNLPVVLSYNDFKKYTILDNLTYQYEQPKEKKRINQQNKLIENIQKNRFNIKKTAESLKISQKQLYIILLCLPIIKIEKLARIDQQSENQDITGNNKIPNGRRTNMPNVDDMKDQGDVKENQGLIGDQELVEEFKKELEVLGDEEVKLYEQFVQLWLVKISTKLGKLSDWEKGTKWFSDKLIDDQKNNLASALKQKI